MFGWWCSTRMVTLYSQRPSRRMMGRDMVIHTVTKCDLNAVRVVSVYRRIRARLAAEEVIGFDVLIAETAKAASMPPERGHAGVFEWIETRPLGYLGSGLFFGSFSGYPATEKLAAMGLAANHVAAASDVGLHNPHAKGLQSLVAAASANGPRDPIHRRPYRSRRCCGSKGRSENSDQIIKTDRGISDLQDVSRSIVRPINTIA